MSAFTKFMKENKKKIENVEFAPTKSLVDENGEPLKWIFRAVETKEERQINDMCLVETPIKGNPNSYKVVLNMSKYMAKFISKSVVEPNLNDKELQDSYGVMSAEDLIVELVDNPSEYERLFNFVKVHSGIPLVEDKVEEAKN